MRILIAEDDQVLADGLLRALRASGYAVDQVGTGGDHVGDDLVHGGQAGRWHGGTPPQVGLAGPDTQVRMSMCGAPGPRARTALTPRC